jgi:hypothetical protein
VFIFCTIARKRRVALSDCGVKLLSESYLGKDPLLLSFSFRTTYLLKFKAELHQAFSAVLRR